MSTNKIADIVHRISLTESEILGVIAVMTQYRNSNTLHPNETAALNKLRKKEFEFSEGIATAAYVVTGRNSNEGRNISAKLGISAEEMWLAALSNDEKFDFDMDRADYNANPSNIIMSEIEFARRQMGLLTGTISNEVNQMKDINSLNDSIDSELGDLLSKL